MLPKTRRAPMPANPAALPKALEGTRRSLNFFLTSSFCSLIYAYVHLCQHACTCVSIYALVSACVHVCQYMCTCVSILLMCTSQTCLWVVLIYHLWQTLCAPHLAVSGCLRTKQCKADLVFVEVQPVPVPLLHQPAIFGMCALWCTSRWCKRRSSGLHSLTQA